MTKFTRALIHIKMQTLGLAHTGTNGTSNAFEIQFIFQLKPKPTSSLVTNKINYTCFQ